VPTYWQTSFGASAVLSRHKTWDAIHKCRAPLLLVLILILAFFTDFEDENEKEDEEDFNRRYFIYELTSKAGPKNRRRG
jgi:hypothetical protein